jgi:anti-sigma regulatory factor (Ser/Thr protein kinase)
MAQFKTTYPSTREMADLVLDDLLQFLSELSVEEDLVRALTLAVSEAFTNAALHGNQERPDKTVEVYVRVNETQVVADIVDQGKGGLKQVESKKPSSSMDEGGRGIDLIRHFADSSYFTETDDGGLKVSIVLHRKKKTTV